MASIYLYDIPGSTERIFLTIAKIIAESHRISPDGIVQKLVSGHELDKSALTTLRAEACQLAFLMVGWASLLYIPEVPRQSATTDFKLDYSESSCFSKTLQPLADMSGGCVMEIYSSFRPSSFTQKHNHYILPPRQLPSKALYVSNVNAKTIIHIGQIQIQWVTCISAHLHLDVKNRRLSLFRLPSVRTANFAIDQTVMSILEHYEDLNVRDCLSPYQTSSLLSEIMSSYQVIFGLDKRSIRHYRHVERKRLLEKYGGCVDPLLDELCKKESPGPINFKQTFDVRMDFPILGSRFLALQNYILSRNPSRLRELWNDRRDQLRWYTFWAVIFFGTIGLALGIIQTVATVMQTAITWKGYEFQKDHT
ncbi:hypothetical protein PRK78_005588 [Emydomyces testavorans]|uniref:Uncharacterized protein n=1 Tax=Emydomyces testavorans TaxID=2070801 RepID=A0AAF0IK70_9EURO|nr:hypothetical protein PRK78_005588 [Emydomyces testavorans]